MTAVLFGRRPNPLACLPAGLAGRQSALANGVVSPALKKDWFRTHPLHTKSAFLSGTETRERNNGGNKPLSI